MSTRRSSMGRTYFVVRIIRCSFLWALVVGFGGTFLEFADLIPDLLGVISPWLGIMLGAAWAIIHVPRRYRPAPADPWQHPGYSQGPTNQRQRRRR